MTPSSQLPANANASRRAFIGHEGSAPRARGKMNYDGYFSGFRGFAGGVMIVSNPNAGTAWSPRAPGLL
jgi:hypothetical protein